MTNNKKIDQVARKDGSGERKGKPASYRQFAYQNLIQRIASGELPFGTPLYEVPLARELGISRTPVREAIGQLIADGVACEITGRGTIVAEPTKETIIELYQLREAVESYAVSMVAEKGLFPREIEVIQGTIDEMETIKSELGGFDRERLSEGMQRFLAADMRFHQLLLQTAGNWRFFKIIKNIRLLIHIFTIQREHHSVGLVSQVIDWHRQILDAVVQRNPERAAQFMKSHIRVSLEERLDEYRKIWHDSSVQAGNLMDFDFGL